MGCERVRGVRGESGSKKGLRAARSRRVAFEEEEEEGSKRQRENRNHHGHWRHIDEIGANKEARGYEGESRIDVAEMRKRKRFMALPRCSFRLASSHFSSLK